jgi:hypothetical protein
MSQSGTTPKGRTFADELKGLDWFALHFIDFREAHLCITELWVDTYDCTNIPMSKPLESIRG